MFRVTTLPIEEPDKIPKLANQTAADFAKDFFGKPAYLTVSGQVGGLYRPAVGLGLTMTCSLVARLVMGAVVLANPNG